MSEYACTISNAAASALASPAPPAVRYAARNKSARSRLPPPSTLYRMASPISAPTVARARSHARSSAASIAARSARHVADDARAACTASLLAVDDVETPVGSLDESLHSGFRRRQLIGRGAQILNAFLEQGERSREIDTLAFELAGDLLEAREALLERHGVDRRGVPVTRAGTTPSRTISSHGMSGRHASAETSVAPSSPRATE